MYISIYGFTGFVSRITETITEVKFFVVVVVLERLSMSLKINLKDNQCRGVSMYNSAYGNH